MIGYNRQLKEQAIRQTQDVLNQLTNQVFALQNKVENFAHQEETGSKGLEDFRTQLQDNQDSIADVREGNWKNSIPSCRN